MSTPVPNNNAPNSQEQKWWRADIRTFIMNLWFIILLAFGFFQSIILNILTTPPNEWGARLTQAFDENSSYFSATYSQLIGFAVLVLILVAGSIDWWFTRYSLDDLAIHRRSGFLFKKNRTIRLESVQSVDISRPLVARLLGLSELRFEVADGSSEALHIKYVSARKAEVLRRTAMASINLLRSEAAGRPVDVLPDSMQISAERMPAADQLHQPFEASYGAPAQNSTQQVTPQQGAQQPAPEQPAPQRPGTQQPAVSRRGARGRMPMPVAADPSQPPIFRISNVRLIASIMLEHLVWLVPAVALMVGAAVFAAIMDGESPFLIFMALLPGTFVPLLGYLGTLWARFDGAANFKITPSGQGGVTLRYGFTGTHTQNVMVERIQALAVEQSILWRAFGWYRIKMTIAGIGIEQNDNQKLVTRNVALPVGNKQETLMVLRLLLPALDEAQAQVLLDTADGSLKSQKPQVPAMIVTPSSARWMDLLTWKRNGVTTVGYTAGSVQASTRIDSDAARSSVGEHTRGDLLLIRGGYFIRTLSIVPVSRVLSVSWGQGPLQRAFGCASVHFGTVPGPVRTLMMHLPPRVCEDLVWLMTVRLEGIEPYYRVPVMSGRP
ncbi:PH domain-containing protein [Rothia sp. (in: high G+C Gram-positive bacteria)]|uniref:PH domain-containing protein n=1 Tax=Rothia sp. (in: high G+C Gram-positive bacteria) TaxID=1885016 RepID=UPI001CAC3A8A|nr:PH domain-containing protein [Rothia sp. (in: high G+C Gram-positive bacteria)]MBF1665386.1 PH domain-containing protein [Rothia sp. (in: high G+C Gram-positive bacteria)]MBF1667640.1 PH domain-containing protein [Rothia sp. (in: high G+C Gram-positive bacteria)]